MPTTVIGIIAIINVTIDIGPIEAKEVAGAKWATVIGRMSQHIMMGYELGALVWQWPQHWVRLIVLCEKVVKAVLIIHRMVQKRWLNNLVSTYY